MVPESRIRRFDYHSARFFCCDPGSCLVEGLAADWPHRAVSLFKRLSIAGKLNPAWLEQHLSGTAGGIFLLPKGGDLVELLGVSAIGAFDGAVELGGTWRKHEQAQAVLLADLLGLSAGGGNPLPREFSDSAQPLAGASFGSESPADACRP